jgi:hypothetical protein
MAVATPAAAAAVNTAPLASAPHRPHPLLLEAPPVSARGDNNYDNNAGIANIAATTGAGTAEANNDDHDNDMTDAAATDTAVAEASAAAGIGWAADAAGRAAVAAGVVRATAANGGLAIADTAVITVAALPAEAAAGQPTYEELLVRNRLLEAELARLRQGAAAFAKTAD